MIWVVFAFLAGLACLALLAPLAFESAESDAAEDNHHQDRDRQIRRHRVRLRAALQQHVGDSGEGCGDRRRRTVMVTF